MASDNKKGAIKSAAPWAGLVLAGLLTGQYIQKAQKGFSGECEVSSAAVVLPEVPYLLRGEHFPECPIGMEPTAN